MPDATEAAAKALAPAISKDINWFTEPGQKQFVDPATISAIATGLVTSFLTAVATGAGQELGKTIVARIRDWIAGKDAAQPVPKAAATMPAEQVQQAMASTEQQLAAGFAEVMPKGRADALAAQVREKAAASLSRE